eukprot:CAMPEP_0171983056 /NCGR_PEP_ID=MMETSP0993-20121228/273086_1 /TAXON_ID=483369 /ORGANISM="non described non described, Strain CCMP2098" /LENGTH=221 /DNA_ID=CAMNT_0012635779 /DNA_START=185 /DNA_END=852 /DNA_ORIENTATION=-
MCSTSTAAACACVKGPLATASSPTSSTASPPLPLSLLQAWRAICYCRRRVSNPAPPPAPASGPRARPSGPQRALPEDHNHKSAMPTVPPPIAMPTAPARNNTITTTNSTTTAMKPPTTREPPCAPPALPPLRQGPTIHRIVTHVVTRLATAATFAAAGAARDPLPQGAEPVAPLRHPLLRQGRELFCLWPQRALPDDPPTIGTCALTSPLPHRPHPSTRLT